MKKSLGLGFILVIAAFLYFYKLAEIPSGVYVDEASVGYNAYSIFRTGRDEYGQLLPIYFRLMGSYSPGFQIYLLAGLTRVFGLGIFLMRSIAVVTMLGSVVVFYLFVRSLGIYRREETYWLTTFFYAILPWSVFSARQGYETTLGFFVFSMGAYLLFRSLKYPKYLMWAVAALSLSTYISHNQRFLAPLFLTGFCWLFRREVFVKKNWGVLKAAILVGIVANIPNLVMTGTRAFWIKNSQFNPENWRIVMTYLSPKTIFFSNPDIDMQHTIPELSLAYNFLVVPYLIGVFGFLKNRKQTWGKFLGFYFVMAILPAILAGQFYNSQRPLVLIFPLMAIIGVGIDKMGRQIIWVPLTAYALVTLWRSYFVLFPVERARGWNWGYDQIAEFIEANQEKKIIVDGTRNPRAYTLLLYHLRYLPEKYQMEVDPYFRENYWQAPTPLDSYYFGNVEVRPVDWEKDTRQGLLIVGDALTISESQASEHGLIKLKEIVGPKGEVFFEVYEVAGFAGE